MEYALMTGITGFMGNQFVKEYLERYKHNIVYAIVTNGGCQLMRERN